MRYSYPYPFYYDQYQVHALLVGPATSFEPGTCSGHRGGGHAVTARGGFGGHSCGRAGG
jgi:hypothetical protein